MSAEAVAALAAAGGMAVVQAAGTDVWTSVRQAVARMLGRGDAGQEAAELTRLDQMQAVLAAGEDVAGQRARWEAVWQTRLEVLLEALDAQGRAAVAAQLAAVIAQAQSAHGGVHAAPGGVAVGGDMRITAEDGSVAGAVVRVEGGVRMTGPFPSAERRS
ncbi:hypothetical protein AB0E04_47755 [Streptomyces sp. NPDC048251]|uniref:hypothetical protein n=1 Tax=unclassified Streptomyces TaxID=2593676 RepID=UPI0033317385